jgi:hypothetical protein
VSLASPMSRACRCRCVRRRGRRTEGRRSWRLLRDE